MDITSTLTNIKMITGTQVDLSYLSNLAPQVLEDPKACANIQSDVQFINQIGSQLFNYFNSSDATSQKVWYDALALGLSRTIDDATQLVGQTPADHPQATAFKDVLNVLIKDCQEIQKIIPTSQNKKS